MRRTVVSLVCVLLCGLVTYAQNLYDIPQRVHTRWYSFENPSGAPGEGGKANEGRKGAAFRAIKAGESVTLADVPGPGTIRRIWCTVRGRPEILRGLVIRFYWENEEAPSAEVPLQDFFGIPFARQVRFESGLFSNPEGRSFNCSVPMPFKQHARIVVENQAPVDAGEFFYDIDCTVGEAHPDNIGYFHALFRRENPTVPGRDFEILPRIAGEGRYLGCNVGIRPIEPYREPFWFGEGELKMYIDDDREWPTLVGTGTEDMVGAAWGLGRFDHLYQGCLLSEREHGVWGFYRYHVPDPVFFAKSIRVALQQIAGGTVGQLRKLPPERYPELVSTHKRFDPADFADPSAAGRWENFEAPQDVCATAYWYQKSPYPVLPKLIPYEERVRDLAIRK